MSRGFLQIESDNSYIIDIDSIESIISEELDDTQEGYEEKRSIITNGIPSGYYTTNFIITMKSGRTIEARPVSLNQNETCFHLAIFHGDEDFQIYSISDFYNLLNQIQTTKEL